MNTFPIKFEAKTNCPAPELTAFNIEVRLKADASVVEAFDADASGSTTAGVTYTPPSVVGALPFMEIDATLIADDYDVVFVSYENACGVVVVDDKVTVNKAIATVAAVGGALMGCAAFSGGIRSYGGSQLGSFSPTGLAIWINGDGRLVGVGENGSHWGQLGVSGINGNTEPADPNILGGAPVERFTVPRSLPNFDFYLPDARFVKVEYRTFSPGFALTDDGKLYTWGQTFTASGQSPDGWGWVTTRTSRNPTLIEANIPFEIVAPNGTWEDFAVTGAANNHIVYGKSGGLWYTWGTGRVSEVGLGHVAGHDPTAPNVSVNVPTLTVWDPPPLSSAAIGNAVGTVFVGTDGRFWNHNQGTVAERLGPHAASSGAAGVQLITESTWTLVLGDDGLVYYSGEGNANGPHTGAFLAQGRDVVYMGQIDHSGLPAGVTLTKIQASGNVGVGLGTDGLLYGWAFNSPVMHLDSPLMVDVVNFYLTAAQELFFITTSGQVLTDIVDSLPAWDSRRHWTILQERMAGWELVVDSTDTAFNTGQTKLSC